MAQDDIAEVGIDVVGRLYVRPISTFFDYIYRAAMEVSWDAATRRLLSPKPREWTYLDWFKQTVAAAADEYGTVLRVHPLQTGQMFLPTSEPKSRDCRTLSGCPQSTIPDKPNLPARPF